MAPSAMKQIEQHHPWEMVDNMVLIIIDQTYTAALEIVRQGMPVKKDGIVELSKSVDPTDPDSPVLTVHASARHCCVAFNSPRGDTEAFKQYTSPKQKTRPGHRLAHVSISVSPGTLYLCRVDGGGREDYWSCADVWPDVAGRGEFGILETIMKRLGAAIRLEKMLLGKANASNYRCPRVEEIVEVCGALEEMRREMDVHAIMRRRLQKRRRFQEITCRQDAAVEQDQADETEMLMKRLRTMSVS